MMRHGYAGHHTFVHHRRLWAQVRERPDERGRYVAWDLTPGSYDRHLERLSRERAEPDPPPLTRQDLLQLVTSITSDDDADGRLAQHDLEEIADAQYRAELEPERGGWHPDDPQYRAWQNEYFASVETSTAGAA